MADPFFRPFLGWIRTPAGSISLEESDNLMEIYEDERRAAVRNGNMEALAATTRVAHDLVKARMQVRQFRRRTVDKPPCAG